MKHNSQNQQVYNSLKTGTKLLSVLLDPDKCLPVHLPEVFAQFMRTQCIYLEAGSGAAQPIPASLISMIKKHIHCPLIVGGGLRTSVQMKSAWDAGADMLLVGTALEEVLSLR